MEGKAVIVVDLQADFTELKHGALAVSGTGKDYIELVLRETTQFKDEGLPIIATRDYHPQNHVSFYTNHPNKKPLDTVEVNGKTQVLWPPHCVQGTPGAEILLPIDAIDHIITTADKSEYDSYSSFVDDGGNKTGLQALLEKLSAGELIIYGLATDFCVKATVLHALELNYKVIVRQDLSRGITPETTKQALEEMRLSGARIE
jgi:nicotinamidase/pyrazinamidase